MTTEIIRIGNSRGIRIPKPILDQCGLSGIVELNVEGDSLRLSRGRVPRSDWENAFQEAGDSAGDELLLDGVGANAFDSDEWQW